MQEMNNSFARVNKKFSKLEIQNSTPKLEIQHQKKSGYSYVAKPNVQGVKIYDDDSKSNSSPPSEIQD